MKKKLIFFSSLIILVNWILIYGQIDKPGKYNSKGLEVTVESAKPTYFLGELVSLDFEINNNTTSDIYLGGTKLSSGYLTLLIDFSNNKFKKYSAVGNGKKTSPTLLKKGEHSKSSSKILWSANRAGNCSDCEAYQETDILTYYAFPKAGSYYIKAVLHVSEGQKSKQIESEPIQITIKEPTGEDSEVWNIIKDREDIGFFIQEGYFRTPNSKQKEKIQQDVEQIISEYPNSLYAESLRQSLAKFQINQKIIQEYLQKNRK